jgi:hypothetical protein
MPCIAFAAPVGQSKGMTRPMAWISRTVSLTNAIFGLLALCALAAASVRAMGEPTKAATAAFDAYVGRVEARVVRQHQSQNGFLAAEGSEADARLRRGELIIEQITPPEEIDLPGAMLHHWRGTAFAPGAKAADFDRLLRDVNAYPQRYAPQVIQAKILAQPVDGLQIVMRARQQHVITVVMDTTYNLSFGQLDARHGYTFARSTKIAEIDAPGTPKERALGPGEEHGFLWRLNTYWSYEERDGGLYMQIESVSLTRAIPRGLTWALAPFVESVPRESLEFTLRSTCNALRK